MSNLNELLIHKITLAQMEAFLRKPSHALLLTGAKGSGKAYLAAKLTSELLQLGKEQKLSNYPYFTHLKRPEGKQDIPIDDIRKLNGILKLKTPGSADIRRVILIEDAQDLNEQSSNALLKMLEEPPSDCVFILTAENPKSILPTIASRTQLLQVLPASLIEANNFFRGSYSPEKIESAWQLSQGGVGLMLALLQDRNGHPLKLAIDEAKNYLRQDKYHRLLLADSLARDKQKLKLMLTALIRLLGALHYSAVKRSDTDQQKSLLASRKLVNALDDKLTANTSPKLVALELSLNLL